MAAIMAGCRKYFAYPITPQNEIPEYMAVHMPEVGGVFLQAESELAAINMAYGAAAAGERVMTSTAGPGYSLMLEGISGIARAELPVVLVFVMRGGPGIGSLENAQLDYFSATKGGGHGGYRNIVLSASSVQELFNLAQLAFELADYYRVLVMLLVDGLLGQIMEPIEIRPFKDGKTRSLQAKTWALTGTGGCRPQNIISTMLMREDETYQWHQRMAVKYKKIQAEEVRYATYCLDDARMAVVAYGMTARVAETAIDECREQGIPVGLFRPISLFPFPYQLISDSTDQLEGFLVAEVNMGQMVEDVRLAVDGRRKVSFVGRGGGLLSSQEIADGIKELWSKL